jgi:hypothetical protein
MRVLLSLILMLVMVTGTSVAQQLNSFAEPRIIKVANSERAEFERRFGNFNMTGVGFQGGAVVDQLPTSEIRSRLQAVYGDPTMRLEDFIGVRDVRPANSIQFEYWFVINDSIPMMVLDIDGPFTRGLVYAGAADFVDMMPEIKRYFSRVLMNVNRPGEFEDVFYSPERNIWFRVSYKAGNYETEEITRPPRFNNLRLN